MQETEATAKRQNRLPLVELENTRASSVIFFSLCVSLPLTALAYGTVHSWALAAFHIGAAFILICWTADAWQSKILRVSRNPIQLPLIGLTLIGLIQLLPLSAPDTDGITGAVSSLSLDPYATRLTVIFLAALLVYFAAMLAFIDSPRRLRIITYVIIIFGFALAFIGIIQKIISPTKIYGLLEAASGSPFGPFVNRHNFAAYMEMTLGVTLGLLFSGAVERDKRLLYFTGIALMGVALLMTQSRGGLVSFVASLGFLTVLWLFKQDSKGREIKASGKTILAGIGIAVAFIVLLLWGVAYIGEDTSLTRFAEQQKIDDPTSSRTEIWKTSVKMIAARPILGWGLGAYGVSYTQFDERNGISRPEQAHNDYLQVLADAGIIGALLGVFFIGSLFYQGWMRRKTKDVFRRGVAMGALTGCFSLLVHSFFDFTLHITAVGLLFLTCVTLATINGRVDDPDAYRHRHRKAGNVTPIRRRRSVTDEETSLAIVRE